MWKPTPPLRAKFVKLRNIEKYLLSSIPFVNIFSSHTLLNKNKKVRRFYKKNVVDFQNLMLIKFVVDKMLKF